FLSVAARPQVSKDLIVSPIFTNDVNYVFERGSPAGENVPLFAPEQAVVSHGLLRKCIKVFLARSIDKADVSLDDHGAIHPPFIRTARKFVIRHVWIEA